MDVDGGAVDGLNQRFVLSLKSRRLNCISPPRTMTSSTSPPSHIPLEICFLWYYRDSKSQWTGFPSRTSQKLTELYLDRTEAASFDFRGKSCTARFDFGLDENWFDTAVLNDRNEPSIERKEIMVLFHPALPSGFASYINDMGLQNQPLTSIKQLRLDRQLHKLENSIRQALSDALRSSPSTASLTSLQTSTNHTTTQWPLRDAHGSCQRICSSTSLPHALDTWIV